jgi:hypothetical protein
LPQFLDTKSALRIWNYVISSDGGLAMRKGITPLFSATGTDGGVMLEKFTDDTIIFGYKNTVAVYQKSLDTVTDIKTNFVQAGAFNGVAYGDYFFVASPRDKLGRISQTLAYDTQSANFAAGLVLTGATSGATAIILEDVDGGATGTLTLGSITGTFADDEIITDSATGSAKVNGVLGFTYTVITNAPMCQTVTAIDSRLVTGAILADSTSVRYSEKDLGANPPFTTWTNATGGSDGGIVRYRNAGTVRSIVPLGNLIVVLSDNGKFAFSIDLQDVGGTLTKIDTPALFRNDFGGARGAIVTNKGIFYVNELGVWQLVSVGQSNIPFSKQETLDSVLLGSKFFDNIDLSQTSLLYDEVKNVLYIACAKDSATNNLVIGFNTEFKAFFEIKGWGINRFMADNGVYYGIGSDQNKVWTLFDGYDDDGTEIWTDFYQEIPCGPLHYRNEMSGQYFQGNLSPSSDLRIAFDIYDVTGTFIPEKKVLQWTQSNSAPKATGWGIAQWGIDEWGVGEVGTSESFKGSRARIKNFQRLRVHITAHGKVPHSLNWFSLDTNTKMPIRNRQMTQIS